MRRVRAWATLCVGVVLAVAGAASAQEPRALEGQVALVTGSTSGLGRVLAFQLSELGAGVIVHGRNAVAGRAVVDSIRGLGGRAWFHEADLGSREQVRQLAAAIRRDHDRLDLLINNAGVGPAPDERLTSADGLELRFHVNYLAGFQLTHLLLPLLTESAPAQVVMVASRTQADLDFDDLMLEEQFGGGRAYAQSKLAQIMFTFDLAPELEGSGVRINAVHPAPVMDTKMMAILGRDPQSTAEDGARSVMKVVLSPDGWNGRYFHETEPGAARPQAYDPQARARLREVSLMLAGLGTSSRVEVEVREIAFARTMADRDLDAFLSFIAPDAVFFGREGAIRGREAIARAWAPYFEGPDAPFAWRPDVVEVLESGNLALTSGPVLSPSGETVGRFNTIWRREPDGAWRVVFDRGS